MPRLADRLPSQNRPARRSGLAAMMATLVCALLFVGCTTPDLKPFADASKSLSMSVKTGGDLAIKPLARIPLWDGEKYVQPSATNHPAKALAASWENRRHTMDAVLVYSTSLAAINDAAAHRKENATELVNSVQGLCSAVPGFGAAFNSAGDLIVKGLEITVEIKAWHDMRRAVKAADPAIQLVAEALKKDFAVLSTTFQLQVGDQLIQKSAESFPIEVVYLPLQSQRDAQREAVARAPADATVGAELDRLDRLMDAVKVDLDRLQSDRDNLVASREDGKEFFAAAIEAVAAWASAHAELVKSFEEQRTPNLALLAARAQELNEIVGNLKK